MKFDLVMPSKLLLSEEAEYVYINGEEGAFGVLDGHSPFISSLKPGELRIKQGDKEQIFCVGFGLADVQPKGVTILAEEAVRKEDINTGDVEKKLADVTRRVENFSKEDTQSVVYQKAVKEQTVLQAQLEVSRL